MRAERRVKRALAPVTTPQTRRWLIARRNGVVSAAATVRGAGRQQRLRPSFVIAGVQKGGTTYLYQELVRHPQVLPSLTKEVHYFSDGYSHGPSWYRGFFPLAPASHDGPATITGEASPGYLFHPWFPSRVIQDLPDVRVIVMLRDPVKRAFSQYLHERRLGFEKAETFAEALALEDSRTAADLEQARREPGFVSKRLWHHSYRARGHYQEQLERLYASVPREQVLVIVSEDFYADTATEYARVCGWLGLPAWQPESFGRNDMAAPPVRMDEQSRDVLRAHFAPLTDDLEHFLGRPLPWPRR